MGELDGKVAVVTGAGRGLGRAHALELARQGAKVVVNDLGVAADGSGRDESAGQGVVDEIKSAGGEAVAHFGDVADWEQSKSMITTRSIPASSSSASRVSRSVMSPGTAAGLSTAAGCGSKVTTADSSPSSRARAVTSSSRCRWPRCTPS